MIENVHSVYNQPSVYNQGGSGGGGISCIRCCKGYDSKYIEIPIICSNLSKFEVGFNLCGNWGKNALGVFAGFGNTYYPPISLYDVNRDNSQYSLSCGWLNTNQTGVQSVLNKIYPNNFNFYHAEIYYSGTDAIFKLTDLNGNIIINSLGHSIANNAISKIRLFVYGNNLFGNIPGFEIYYFKVDDILDLMPDEQNGVPGFTDKISGNFYAPNDSTAFEAVKARSPL